MYMFNHCKFNFLFNDIFQRSPFSSRIIFVLWMIRHLLFSSAHSSLHSAAKTAPSQPVIHQRDWKVHPYALTFLFTKLILWHLSKKGSNIRVLTFDSLSWARFFTAFHNKITCTFDFEEQFSIFDKCMPPFKVLTTQTHMPQPPGTCSDPESNPARLAKKKRQKNDSTNHWLS